VEGPVVAQLQGVFTDNWMQTHGGVLHGPGYFPKPVPAGNQRAHCFKTGPRDGVETARLVYLYSMAAAQKHIRIIHSYFVPDDLIIDTLLAARRRGVRIEVITPGIIDANVVRRASRARWNELLKAGVEFYEFQPAMLHCKVMILDDIWVVSGTVNFDNRSFRINDENSLGVWDQGFAQAQIATFDRDKANSRRIELAEFKNRPWYLKATEHFAACFRAWL
jgi:cardiolipin synthase